MKALVREVRTDRKQHALCHSAQDGVCVSHILVDIVETGIYKEDYETITKIMLFQSFSYEEAIKVLERIIESGVFDT